MILDFGIHKGKELSDLSIPDEYIKWLASRGKYKSKLNQFEYAWKLPIMVWLAALKEIEDRGYKIIGERFEKEDEL